MSLRINRAVARDCFDKQQPVFLCKVQNNIGHLSVCLDRNSQGRRQNLPKTTPFLTGVSRVHQLASRREALCEFEDNGADQLTVFSGA